MRPKSSTRPAVRTLAAVCTLISSASCNGADEPGGGQAADTFEEIPFSPDGGTFSCTTNDFECMRKCPTWSFGCTCTKSDEQWSCNYSANPRYAPMAEEDALRMLVEHGDQEHVVYLIGSKTLSDTERNSLAERIADIMITAPREDCRWAIGPQGCLRRMALSALLAAARQGSVDALVRAYETAEAERKCRMLEEPIYDWEGEAARWVCEGPHNDVGLSDIADCCGDVGFEYVRRVFRTAERPPPESATEYGDGRRGLLRTPWCQAGNILFSDEINRAYGWPEGAIPGGGSLVDYQHPEPLRRQVSNDAAAWWEICWDGRNTKPKKWWWPFG